MCTCILVLFTFSVWLPTPFLFPSLSLSFSLSLCHVSFFLSLILLFLTYTGLTLVSPRVYSSSFRFPSFRSPHPNVSPSPTYLFSVSFEIVHPFSLSRCQSLPLEDVSSVRYLNKNLVHWHKHRYFVFWVNTQYTSYVCVCVSLRIHIHICIFICMCV